MSDGTSSPARRPGGARRLAKALAFLAFLALAVEAGAAVVLSAGLEKFASPGATRELVEKNAGVPARIADRRLGPENLGIERPHPYAGYLPRDAANEEMADGAWLNQEALFAADSPAFAPDPSVLVVGVTGGSVAAQLLIHGRAALASELARIPRFGGRRIWFVGLAFGGWKQPQQLQALTYLLALGGRLDVLINLDGFNEVALHASENAMQGVAPSFPRSWYFRATRDDGIAPRLGELAHLRRSRAVLSRETLRSPFFASFTYRLVWKMRDSALNLATRNVEREVKKWRAPRDLATTGPHLRPVEESTLELAAIWRASSIQLANLCLANGIEYLHGLQPNQYVEGTKPLSEEERARFLNPEHLYGARVPAGYEALFAEVPALRAAEVPFADLTRIFGGVEETVYADDCCHFNERGNALLARAVAEALMR